MHRREVEVADSQGLNAAASGQLAQAAAKFLCDVSLTRSGRRVNAKSFMRVIMLAAGKGAVVIVETDGPDEIEALEAIAALIERDSVGER